MAGMGILIGRVWVRGQGLVERREAVLRVRRGSCRWLTVFAVLMMVLVAREVFMMWGQLR